MQGARAGSLLSWETVSASRSLNGDGDNPILAQLEMVDGPEELALAEQHERFNLRSASSNNASRLGMAPVSSGGGGYFQ
jgi:hypothetical protein